MTLQELEHEIRTAMANRQPVGQLLRQAKEFCRHGQFTQWAMQATGKSARWVQCSLKSAGSSEPKAQTEKRRVKSVELKSAAKTKSADRAQKRSQEQLFLALRLNLSDVQMRTQRLRDQLAVLRTKTGS